MGSQVNETGIKTFTAAEALEQYRRVKLAAGSGTSVQYAAAGEKGIGTTTVKSANGAPVSVKLWNFPGTRKITASAAASAGDDLKGAASGKFGGAAGTAMVTALEAASGDGSIIEGLID